MKLNSRVLNTLNFPGTHDSKAIDDLLKEGKTTYSMKTLYSLPFILKLRFCCKYSSYRIFGQKIVAVVTENASNMKRVVEICGWIHIPCFAHSLNLVVTGALQSNLEIHALLTNCRHAVTFFKQSPKSKSKLKQFAQNDQDCHIETLKQEVPTRWNCTLTMIRSILILYNFLNEVLGPDDLSNLAILLDILEPFEEITNELSSQTSLFLKSSPLFDSFKKV